MSRLPWKTPVLDPSSGMRVQLSGSPVTGSTALYSTVAFSTRAPRFGVAHRALNPQGRREREDDIFARWGHPLLEHAAVALPVDVDHQFVARRFVPAEPAFGVGPGECPQAPVAAPDVRIDECPGNRLAIGIDHAALERARPPQGNLDLQDRRADLHAMISRGMSLGAGHEEPLPRLDLPGAKPPVRRRSRRQTDRCLRTSRLGCPWRGRAPRPPAYHQRRRPGPRSARPSSSPSRPFPHADRRSSV